MDKPTRSDKYNLNYIMIKSLYFGLTVNIIGPGTLLFVCYYLDINRQWSNPMVGYDNANILFILIAVLSLINFGWALWKKSMLQKTLMVKSEETLEEDLRENLAVHLKPIFIVIALVAVYGVGYYFLTGRFREAAFFEIISFVVFQFVRPRFGFIQKLIESQLDLLKTKKSA